MHKGYVNLILIFCLLLCSELLGAQALYDLNSLQKIEINFTQSNWDYQMDTAKVGAEEYLMASEVKINGTLYDSVGVKYKGNSSFDSTQIKNPLHISLNEFKDQKHQGYSDIKLSNGYGDPSMIREVLAYQILKNYMHCSLSNFAQVYINGNYIGLYSSDENVDKNFCADHFYSSQNTFIKCNPTVSPGPTTKSNFKYINGDSNSYNLYYEIKSDYGWNDLVALCDSVSNSTNLEKVVDMDRVLWMLAFNNLLINLDSYNGVFAQNHYTYKDHTGHYNPILWDLNMAFGGFPFAGAGGTSMGSLTIPQMQQFSIANHATDTFWPLINSVYANATSTKKYIAHMRTMLNEFFVSHQYDTLANQLQTLVDTAVLSDNHKYFSYTQFQHAMDSTVDVGSYDVPGIKTLMDSRTNYLLTTPEFMAVPPSISNITPGVSNPVFNSNFVMTALVNNSNLSGVTFGFRFDKTQKFQQLTMIDDGLHGDGAANDNVFGVSLSMSGGQMQYYIYAENNDAGIFSPERAEHEFHILNAASQIPVSGQIAINELLSSNLDHERDEYGNTEDWIELYNTSTVLLDLSDSYLSDTISNLTKWKFPPNTTIPPNSYLTIWADDDSSQQIYHTNFQLNSSSGSLFLSNSTSQIIDSISFSNQNTNISFGRYPNGTGSFIPMNTTFGSINNNYPLGISTSLKEDSFLLYPNPSSNDIQLNFSGQKHISIYTIQGQRIFSSNANKTMSINISSWRQGIYFVQCGRAVKKLVIE